MHLVFICRGHNNSDIMLIYSLKLDILNNKLKIQCFTDVCFFYYSEVVFSKNKMEFSVSTYTLLHMKIEVNHKIVIL